MPLNKLDNFIKNTDGRILYVSPSDLNATDNITNQGNSLAQPFKTIQRALLEAARFSYLRGSDNDITEKTTILLLPGEHVIDNRPGFAIKTDGGVKAVSPSGDDSKAAQDVFSLSLSSNFDLTQEDNILYKFNSIKGGVIVPRGTSIVGLDLRKSKIRPKYVPNPTDSNVDSSAIFRITGACYFWQFSIFDGNESELVYTDDSNFSTVNQSTPTFSHHKLTAFEYADGVNLVPGYNLTDLDIYYSKLSNAFNSASGRDIIEKYPTESLGFAKQRPEWEIVGAFATDPVSISTIVSGDGLTLSNVVTVTTSTPHGLSSGTPIKINGVSAVDYNVSTKVQNVLSSTQFTYVLPFVRNNLPAAPSAASATVTIETDTVGGASPYIFNVSLRSVWGMNGMLADGSKASGFRSMVVAQFTGVSLQKDDRAFAKYDPTSRVYRKINLTPVTGSALAAQSSSTNPETAYHLDSEAIYRQGWEQSHIKLTNDAFIQIVSVFAIGFNKHFYAESGADGSITNSNSNFGQFSLAADGFKKSAFEKDDQAYVTSIITPRSITGSSFNVDWVPFDVGLTTSVGISSHLYLFGYNNPNDLPPNISQGYRIGANASDKLYLNFNNTTYEAPIYMVNSFSGNVSLGTIQSQKSYSISGSPASNIFTTTTAHNLTSGEKVRIYSDNGDIPENLENNKVYYAIASDVDGGLSSSQFKLASSLSNSSLNIPITVYGGTSLSVVSTVSDKQSGDIGSPIQFDSTNNAWYIHTDQSNAIYSLISAQGVSGLSPSTNSSYVKRITDNRGLDEKIYKLRVFIPKESDNTKDPLESFVIQESSNTGIRNDNDTSLTSLTTSDYQYNRNLRLIATCSETANVVTVRSEHSHNLKVDDIVIIKNVKSSNNVTATDNIGYNGTFKVTGITNAYTFTYSTTDVNGLVHANPGTFTNDTSVRNTLLPRFEKNDVKTNYYIYRKESITQYIKDVQDGVYHLYVLNAGNAIETEFTNLKYSQNITDLYPQNDRDNPNDNPNSSATYAKRFPIGDVLTNDLKKSVTRESVDKFLKDFGVGLKIQTVSSTSTSVTLTFDREHGLNGIVSCTIGSNGTGHTSGTFYNVRLFNNAPLSSWNGAYAKVVIDGSGNITSVEVTESGSNYSNGSTLYLDTAVIGGTGGDVTIATADIVSAIGNVVQITGNGTLDSDYYRITDVLSTTQIRVAKASTGYPTVVSGQYAFITGNSITINSTSAVSAGIATFTCSSAHGLLTGNQVKIINSSAGNLGNYIVREVPSVTTFNVEVSGAFASTPAFALKHGVSSNEAVSDKDNENLGVRDITFYDNDILTAVSFTSDTTIQVTSPVSGTDIIKRFPLGTYIQVNGEIMRVANSTLIGPGNNQLVVIRAALGTRKKTHAANSIIKKIKPLAVEFRRPSILRASGHTFEYLGYGPGNYSTALPQLQVKTLNEKEDFLAQSQESACGSVIYTGTNSNGDFFIGNTKYSASSGEQTTFDIPIPTITGEDPSRLSVVFDEVTIKERLVVEGGNSGTVLSQFDGPVAFNNDVKFNGNIFSISPLKVFNTTQSTSKDTGALIVEGGAGIEKNLYVGGDFTVSGTANFLGDVNFNNAEVDNITVGNIRLAVANNQTIDTKSGNLVLSSIAGGNVSITTTTFMSYDLNVSGDITAFYSSDERLKDNITPIPDALNKVISISGNTFSWNENSTHTGTDVGVIAQEIQKVLPDAVIEKDNGYLGVSYEKIIPLLIEAIKDLSHKVEVLEKTIDNK